MKKISSLFLVILIFISSRLVHLLSMPPFLDETIYIRWLTAIKFQHDWLIPLKEFGWEPFNIWLAALMNNFTHEPLLALRLTAAFFGLLTFFILTKKEGLLTGLLLIFSPVFLLYDRLGLRGDTAVVFATVLCFFALKERLINRKVNSSYIIGLAIAIEMFSKTTAAVLPISTLLAYLFFKAKLKRTDLIGAGLTLIPFCIYWLTGTLSLVINKKDVFFGLVTLPQIKNNLIQTTTWFWQYLTWPVVLLSALGLIVVFLKKKPFFKLLLIMLLPTFILVVGFSKIIFPRYLLGIYIFCLIISGYGWQWFARKLPKNLRWLTIIFLFPSIFLSWQIITNFPVAQLPEIERWQYVNGWPSGYGVRQLADYLKTDTLAVLVTESDDLIKTGVAYYWPEHPFLITQTATASAYFVANINDGLPQGLQGQLIKEFIRPENKSSIKLFKLNP